VEAGEDSPVVEDFREAVAASAALAAAASVAVVPAEAGNVFQRNSLAT